MCVCPSVCAFVPCFYLYFFSLSCSAPLLTFETYYCCCESLCGRARLCCMLLQRCARAVSTSLVKKATMSTSTSTRSFRIALCQLSVTGDKAKNLAEAAAAIRTASAAGADLVSLPECFQSPYATDQFAAYAETIATDSADINPETEPSTAMLRDEAKRNNVYIVGGSIPERSGDNIFNTCVVFDPQGNIVARHRKMHLFDIDIPGKIQFRESDTLTAGDEFSFFDFVKPARAESAENAEEANEEEGEESEQQADVACRIGIGICYDMRFAELAQIQRDNGCEMLIYPGAFNTTTGQVFVETVAMTYLLLVDFMTRSLTSNYHFVLFPAHVRSPLHWELLQRARAVDNQLFFAACSPARSENKDEYQVCFYGVRSSHQYAVKTRGRRSILMRPVVVNTGMGSFLCCEPVGKSHCDVRTRASTCCGGCRP